VLDYAAFVSLAALYTAHTVRLSGDSLTLFLCTAPSTQAKAYWRGANTEVVTDDEWDEIEALAAKAYGELMIEVATMPLGTIFAFASASAPTGSLECDGASYLRVDYPELYAALDTAYVTDADNFVVPDLRGRTIVGVGTGAGLTARAVDEQGGTETHVLTEAELAAHDHTITDPGHLHSNLYGAVVLTNARGTQSNPIAVQGTRDTIAATTGVTVQNAGGGNSHQNMPPFLALRYAVWSST